MIRCPANVANVVPSRYFFVPFDRLRKGVGRRTGIRRCAETRVGEYIAGGRLLRSLVLGTLLLVNSFTNFPRTIRADPARTFASEISHPWPLSLEEVPALDQSYESSAERERTITILGSSRSTEALKPYVEAAEELSRSLIVRGYHVLTGCGDQGIMGAAYRGAIRTPASPKTAGENRVILVRPISGPVDLVHARAIAVVDSEAARIELFYRVSATFIIFPGGAGTLQEMATLIARNRYRKDSAPSIKIFAIDRAFYGDFRNFLRKQESIGVLGAHPDDLVQMVDNPKQVLDNFLAGGPPSSKQ